jgi:hypothetical protein
MGKLGIVAGSTTRTCGRRRSGLFFKTIKDIGQIHGDIKVADVIKNDYVAGANAFDTGKVKADTDGYKLPDDYASIDVEAIRKAL